MGLNWKFQRGGGGGGGVKPKSLPWEGYGYFLEQHNPTYHPLFYHPHPASFCLGFCPPVPPLLHFLKFQDNFVRVLKTILSERWYAIS